MENAHSIFPPSSAHIWGADKGCTAWVGMARQYPEPDEPDVAKDEGTASHEIGENLILKGIGWPSGAAGLAVGRPSSNGTIIDDDMFDCARLYANDVLEVYSSVKDNRMVKVGVEDKGPILRVHPECFGTKDCWMYDVVANILYIWDYKYGHRFVEVFENLQGVAYAAGLIDQLGLPDDCTVVFRIVQPRSYSSEGPVREWRVKMKELFFLFGILAQKAMQANPEYAMLQTGPHCRDCYPRFACPAALQAGMGLYEVATAPTSHNLSKGALGLQLTIINRALEQLKSMKGAFEGQVEATIKQGEGVPGWGLKQSTGREVWTKPIDEVIAMGEMMKIPVDKPNAITPNQARAKGVPESLLAVYAGRTKKGLTLKPDNGIEARKCFSYNESTLNKE